MNKLNKKGFTLIEMLVVIAIIAVLVAIIIPTVTSATDKAAAAANAANLRSYKATLVTEMLSGSNKVVIKEGGAVEVDDAIENTAPVSKKVGTKCPAGQTIDVTSPDGNNLVVKYGTHTIKAFADVAEGTTKAADLS